MISETIKIRCKNKWYVGLTNSKSGPELALGNEDMKQDKANIEKLGYIELMSKLPHAHFPTAKKIWDNLTCVHCS